MRLAFGFALQLWIFTIKAKLLPARLFIVKWMSWYFFGANFIPYCFVYATHLLHIWFNLVQLFAAVLPYAIKFVLFINLKAIVSWLLLNILKSLNIKNKNRINNRGDFYKISISVNIRLLLYPLNTILVVCPIKKV